MSKTQFDYGTERLKEIEALKAELEFIEKREELEDQLRSNKVRKLYKMWLRNQGEII